MGFDYGFASCRIYFDLMVCLRSRLYVLFLLLRVGGCLYLDCGSWCEFGWQVGLVR